MAQWSMFFSLWTVNINDNKQTEASARAFRNQIIASNITRALSKQNKILSCILHNRPSVGKLAISIWWMCVRVFIEDICTPKKFDEKKLALYTVHLQRIMVERRKWVDA